MQKLLAILVGTSMLALSSCNALSFLLPNTVTVALVNPGTLDVDGQLFYDDDETALNLLNDINALDNFLREFGQQFDFVVPAGDTVTFTRSCNDLQAIFVDDANVRIAGVVTSDDDTNPIREGDDFICGSTITYTFVYSDLGLGMNITTGTGLNLVP